MKKLALFWIVTLALSVTTYAYTVSVGTYVSNAGKTVTVPIELDSAAGLSYAGATITYDPQVLVVTKTEAGTLRGVMPEDFVSTDTNGTLTVTIFGGVKENVASGSGSIAKVTFAVREGTAGLYSDLAVTDVSLGEKTGLKDVTVGNPITTQNGMVRVMSTGAAVDRLENAQTICADTKLGSILFKGGDAIQASDDQTTPIVISGSATAEAVINVIAPVNGWASGIYTLIRTAKSDKNLDFDIEGMPDAEVKNITSGGVTTYTVKLEIAGEVPIEMEGETLAAGTMNLIRENAKLANADAVAAAKKIVVSGPSGMVSVIADMGIAPSFAPIDAIGTLKLTYAMPKLELTAFNPETGAIRFKVTPGAGNTIVSELATGYVHVYGTDNLAEKMRYISKVGFDLTPYLKSDSKGEGVINVTLGYHTFLKVKIEAESKNEGDVE